MKKVLRILTELDDRRTTLIGLALATLNWLTTRAPQEAGALKALGISLLAQAQAAAALFGLALNCDYRLNAAEKLVGLAALLSFSPFVRMAHNLRADIGLAVYGAIIVWALIEFDWSDIPQTVAFWVGLALWPALECVPTAGLALAAGFGGALLLPAYWQRSRRTLPVFAAGIGLALALYAAVRFFARFRRPLGGLLPVRGVLPARGLVGAARPAAQPGRLSPALQPGAVAG